MFSNIVEYEANMDNFEEQQEILRQLAEEEIKVGDPVILTEENMQSFFGKGVHTVESVLNGGDFFKIRLWHGKRSIGVSATEIKKFEHDDITVKDIYKAVNTLPDEYISVEKLTNALILTFAMPKETAEQIAIEYCNYVI